MKQNANKLWLFLVLLVMGFNPVHAQELTVADGTNTNYSIPICHYVMDSSIKQSSQIIYPESMLTALKGKLITRMTFYVDASRNGAINFNNVEWAMGSTDKTNFSDEQAVTNLTTVYSGDYINYFTMNGNNVIRYTLQTPFTYTGGNLVIQFKHTQGTGFKLHYFYGQNTNEVTGRMFQYNQADVNKYGPKGYISVENRFLPKVTFQYEEQGAEVNYTMSVTPTDVTFPITEVGQESTATVKVTNTCRAPFKLTATADAPFTVECPAEEVAPEATADVTLRFNPIASGVTTGKATLTIDGTETSQELNLSGEGLDLNNLAYKEVFTGLAADNLLPQLWEWQGKANQPMKDFIISDEAENRGLTYPYINESEYIISPVVNGEIVTYLKATGNNPFVKFFACTENKGTFIIGNEITPLSVAPALNKDEWSIAKLQLEAPTHVAVLMQQASIKLFAAADMEITKATFTNVAFNLPEKLVANAEGNVTLPFEFTIKNTGNEVLKGSDYTILVQDSEKTQIGEAFKGVDIAVRASETIKGEVVYKPNFANAESIESEFYAAAPAIIGEPVLIARPTIYNYIGKLLVKDAQGNENATADLGVYKGEKEIVFTLVNNGTAPLEIDECTAVKGINFTLKSKENGETITLPYTLQADAQLTVAITTTTGVYDGEVLTLTHNGLGGTTAISIKANHLSDTTWAENFETYDAGSQPGNGWLNTENSGWAVEEIADNASNTRRLANNNVEPTRIISPKLIVKEGQVLTFAASGRTADSFLKIYYSTDRTTWILTSTLSATPQEGETKLLYPETDEAPAIMQSFTANIPAGQYYIAFEAGLIYLDDIYGYEAATDGHDIYVNSIATSRKPMANTQMTVTLTATNLSVAPETTYTAELLVNEQPEVTLEGKEPWTDKKEFVFNYTPTTSGELTLQARIHIGEYTVESEAITIQVAEEETAEAIRIGAVSTEVAQKAPLNLSAWGSKSETIYPANVLTGLEANDAISKIALPYYNQGAEGTAKIQIWVLNTEDSMPIDQAPDFTAQEALADALFYSNENYVFEQGGNENDFLMAEFKFEKPFVYTGKNIRVIMQSDFAAGANRLDKCYFNIEKKNRTTEVRQEAYTICATKAEVESELTAPQFFENIIKEDIVPDRFEPQMPVMYFYKDKATVTVSGTVSESTTGTALAGVEVSLSADDITYSDQTDEEGKYSIQVIQTNKEYTLATSNTDYFAPYTGEKLPIATSDITNKNIKLDFNGIPNATVVTSDTYKNLTGEESILAPIGNWDVKSLYDFGHQLGEKITNMFLCATNFTDEIAGRTFETMNPNAIIYVEAENIGSIPSEWRNVVYGDQAPEIALKNTTSFAPALEFTAEKVSYILEEADVKETIILPFESRVPNNSISKTYAKAFKGYKDGVLEFENIDWMDAYTPYLIIQDDAISLDFAAKNITFTPDAKINEVTADGLTFTGSTACTDNNEGKYHVFNGTSFVSTETNVQAFRGFFYGANPETTLYLEKPQSIQSANTEGMTIYTATGCIIIETCQAQHINLLSIDGRLLRSIELNEGTNRINNVPAGVYLINNQKVVVK